MCIRDSFEKWIDWENSVLSEEYKEIFIPRLYKEGKKDGKWTWYDTFGNVVKTEIY